MSLNEVSQWAPWAKCWLCKCEDRNPVKLGTVVDLRNPSDSAGRWELETGGSLKPGGQFTGMHSGEAIRQPHLTKLKQGDAHPRLSSATHETADT